MESIPPYWEAFRKTFARAIGDLETEAGQSLLKERSPLTRADRITKPLPIRPGANDPRVKQAEAFLVEALPADPAPQAYGLAATPARRSTATTRSMRTFCQSCRCNPRDSITA